MPYYRCPGCGLTSYSAAGYSAASVCPSCSEALAEDAKLDLGFEPGRGIVRPLPAEPRRPEWSEHTNGAEPETSTELASSSDLAFGAQPLRTLGGEASDLHTDSNDARDANARDRDQAAAERDRLAAARDLVADAGEAELEELERSLRLSDGDSPDGRESVLRAACIRERARAAVFRAASEGDREQAARDRQLAAADREHAAAARSAAGADDLTGALRRGVGLAALQREVDRARRTGDRLVVAFADVDGLKNVNDTDGHVAGDRLLQRVAELIRAHLRPYDVTVRVGGDEFVCSLYGVGTDSARERFGQVGADLAASPEGGSITVGLAELNGGDSLEDLIRRADTALLAARAADGSHPSRLPAQPGRR